MEPFLSEDFLLHTQTARILYHEFAEGMPIFDYHCHLPVEEIAENKNFANLTADLAERRPLQVAGHEDQRRAESVSSQGMPATEEKFQAWAETVPRTIRNPLYHWTHLELKRYFGISGKLLSPATAEEIYRTCSRAASIRRALHPEDPSADEREGGLHDRRPRGQPGASSLIRDDPSFPVKVLPAFRPDRALGDRITADDSTAGWIDWRSGGGSGHPRSLRLFSKRSGRGTTIFHEAGCRVSDHGIETP